MSDAIEWRGERMDEKGRLRLAIVERKGAVYWMRFYDDALSRPVKQPIVDFRDTITEAKAAAETWLHQQEKTT